MTDNRILIPLSASMTVRQTVAYAIRSSLERIDNSDSEKRHTLSTDEKPAPEAVGQDGRVASEMAENESKEHDQPERELEFHLVVVQPFDDEDPGHDHRQQQCEHLLDRAIAWVHEDAAEHDVTIESAVLGGHEYLFGPSDYAEIFARYVEDHEIDRLVLDPEFRPGATSPMVYPLERELRRLAVSFEEAPVERPARHERLTGTDSGARFLAMFGISYAFYLVLGDPTYWFDLLTGAVVGLIVALILSNVTFTTAPTLRASPMRNVRFALYIPYLVFEIVKANLAISVVILRPSMPIDPQLTRINARVRSGLPLLALANSITLTPGTLTVRANDQRLLVHTLIPSAKADLFDGALERAVRFIFHGRRGMRIPSPRERGDAEIIESDDR